MHRRDFLRSAGAVAGGTAAVGTAETVSAQEGESGARAPPDFGGWLSNVGNFSETVDKRGQSAVTVEVGVEANGNYWGFGPPAIHVDTGTTVTWEWTGRGGAHNVVADSGAYKSGSPVAQAGTTFEHTFEQSGISKYYCRPHQSTGMKGAVVVGDDYPTVSADGGPSGPTVTSTAKLLGVGGGFVMTAVLGFAYFVMKYGGDYDRE